ncbi:MAG: hypothetical protein ACK4WJ_02685 [Endomicrobiia bacterium]
MKKFYNKSIKIFLLFFIYNINIVIFCREYSLSFLKLPTTARQTSITGYIALSDDIGGIFCNPSGLVNSSAQVGFSHNEHFQQIKYDFLGYIMTKRNYTLFFGLAILYTNNIEGRTGQKDFDPVYVNIYQTVEPEFYYSMYSFQSGIGIAKNINKNISFGTTLKFVNEKIYDVSADTILLDTGIQYKYNNNFVLGFVLNNFGFPIKYVDKYYSTPMQIGFGAKYKMKKFCFVSDLVKPMYEDFFINFGSEIEAIDFFIIRLGYKYKIQSWYLESEDVLLGLSLGLGLNYFGTKIDYSISSFGELGFSHKVSLIIEFDKVGKFYKLLREKLFKVK